MSELGPQFPGAESFRGEAMWVRRAPDVFRLNASREGICRARVGRNINRLEPSAGIALPKGPSANRNALPEPYLHSGDQGAERA